MAEEADFMRSVLPVLGSFRSEDTSLALPDTDKLTHDDTHRRNRLQQQVQLTLSRKKKKPKLPDSSLSESLSNCHISRSISLGNIQLKQINTFVNHDATPQAARPLRICDRSQWPNTVPPHFHRGFGSFRYSTRPGFNSSTLPTATPIDNFHSIKRPLRNARSEDLRNPRLCVSGLVAKLPIKPVYDDNFEDNRDYVFLPSTSHNAVPEGFDKNWMELEKRFIPITLSKKSEGAFGSHEQTENVSWQAHKRKPSLEVVAGRQPSQPGSLISMAEKSGSSGRIENLEVKKHTMTASTKAGRKNEHGTEMTLKEAVNLLEEDDLEAQITAVNFIQKQCLDRPHAKEKIHILKGIPKLLKVLQNHNEELQQATAGALRNAVFENSENKMDVKDCDGLPVILSTLRKNRDIETRRQLTGLLWNLSSHDLLKEQLAREAVKPITDNVLVPCSGISEGEDPKLDLLADTDVLYNATGCLRNLSSTGPDGRKALRDCEGLIECLIYFIRSTISDYKPNDKATENCVCILHNLSYRFDCGMSNMDVPEVKESKQSLAAKNSNPGCFIINTPKNIEEETEEEYPLLEENASPQGEEWLWSAITIRMYLSLIAVSANQSTKEASIGALQNLTALSAEISQAIANFIVQKEGGLLHVKNMLQDENIEEIRICVSFVKNVSRYRELHKYIVKQVLPDLIAIVKKSDRSSEQPIDVIVTIFHTLINLSNESVKNTCDIINQGALPTIISISTKENGFGPTRAGQAACVLLHTLWKHSELHSSYKKAGFKKSDFNNKRILKAVHSVRE